MKQLVIFDFDGTLVDTLHDIAGSLNAARNEIGEPDASIDTVRSWIGEGLDHLIREALPANDKNATLHEDLKRRYRAQYAKRMYATSKPYPGVDAMLDRLKDCQLAVCSNKTENFVQEMLAHFNMLDRFLGVMGGDTLSVRKPDPQVITHLVAQASNPTQVWMVGDSAVDMRTGKAAKIRTIACAYGIRGRAELEAEHPDYMVDEASAIADIILRP